SADSAGITDLLVAQRRGPPCPQRGASYLIMSVDATAKGANGRVPRQDFHIACPAAAPRKRRQRRRQGTSRRPGPPDRAHRMTSATSSPQDADPPRPSRSARTPT